MSNSMRSSAKGKPSLTPDTTQKIAADIAERAKSLTALGLLTFGPSTDSGSAHVQYIRQDALLIDSTVDVSVLASAALARSERLTVIAQWLSDVGDNGDGDDAQSGRIFNSLSAEVTQLIEVLADKLCQQTHERLHADEEVAS